MLVLRSAYYALVACYVVLWTGGIVTHLRPGGDPPRQWAAAAFLFTAATLASLKAADLKAILLFAFGGFAAELIGVHTGLPFGSYRYSTQLGPGLAGVPLSISFAWLALLLFTRDCSWRIAPRRLHASLIAAAMMTALDLLIDPVATRILGFWYWQRTGPWFGVPIVNFAGWFIVSFALLMSAGKPSKLSRSVVAVGATVTLFFALIALFSARSGQQHLHEDVRSRVR